MQNGGQAIAPLQERQTASGGIQLGAILIVAMAFGCFEGQAQQWPAWAYYPPELLLAFCTRFALVIAFEKPSRFLGAWKSLYWRVLCYECLVWSWSMVFFLSALDASDHKDGFLWLLIIGIIGFSLVTLGQKLISRFRCPHCHQFFFNEKNIKDAEGLYPFSLRNWPNTLCKNCSWPLGKVVALDT